MKQAIEQLAGMQGDAYKSRNYIQDAPPDNARIGDLWIGPGKTLYWTGAGWEKLP